MHRGTSCFLTPEAAGPLSAPAGPAGQELLDANKGRDITELFEGGSGHAHSRAANLLLERYYRGDLVGENVEVDEKQRILQLQAASQDKVVDESKGLLSQVREQDSREAWLALLRWLACAEGGDRVPACRRLVT